MSLNRAVWSSSLACAFLSCGFSFCLAQAPRTTTVAPGETPAPQARQAPPPLHIYGPGILALHPSGAQYVAVKDGVFKLDATGLPMRIAGGTARAIAIDTAGNIFLADSANHRIRRLDAATGIITTIAGTGVKGLSGDNGPALDAQLDSPSGIALDPAGNLYIADGIIEGNDRIRRISAATGVIETIAGTGAQGYSGDGGPATSAQFHSLGGLAVDTSGNLYIADNYNNRIRMVSAATGIITTVAGTGVAGTAGDGGPATAAELNNPLGVALDPEGNLYIADSGNFRIRKLNTAGTIYTTAGSGRAVYPDTQHGYPCALAIDATGNLYVADSGVSRIRKIPADIARETASAAEIASTPRLPPLATTSGFNINLTFDTSVPASAQPGLNAVIAAYEKAFTTNVTVNVDIAFGKTGLGENESEGVYVPYTAWRTALISNAAANPGNTYAAAAVATLPPADPLGLGNVFLSTANARELGYTVNIPIDTTITLSNAVTFENTGQPLPGDYDLMDVTAHELDEGLGIGSALTGLANNAAIPTDHYFAEDYFRYSAAGTRAITTNPNATVYFSYDGGKTSVAQFNQAYTAQNDSNLDRNDWIYGNTGCPATNPHIQDAIACYDQAESVGQAGTPEIIVLNALGYDSGTSLTPQVITFSLGGIAFVGESFSIGASATSGLAVTFSSATPAVCTISGTTITTIAAGTCSIVATQPGNSVYAAVSATQSFIVELNTQSVFFPKPANVSFGVAPFTLSASASSGLPVTFLSNTPAVCTVSGSTVTIVSAGTCTIVASQPGNSVYASAAGVTESFTISPATQTITFASPGNVALDICCTVSFALSATANSGLTVGFASTTPAVCTVSGATVTALTLGTCTITASQPGNANYAAATPVTVSFSVGSAQTITFGSLSGVAFVAQSSFSLTAASSSGLPIAFTAQPAAVCTVSGTTVTIVGGGACTITATQPGNSSFGAAMPVTLSFTAGSGVGGPTIKPAGIVPIYSTATTIQPGSWISIFGVNLASGIANWNNDFPTLLGGVSVTINNRPAYLWYVSPTQINLMAPDDPTTGPVYVTLTNAAGSWTSTVTLAPVSPSFSELDGKHVAGIILRSDGSGTSGSGTYDIVGPTGTSLGYPTVAAKAGDTVVLFGVGFGPTTPPVTAGQLFSGVAYTTDQVQLTIGGTTVLPFFAGLSSAGLYQLNLTIPPRLGTGDQPLTASVGGAQTQSGVVISLTAP